MKPSKRERKNLGERNFFDTESNFAPRNAAPLPSNFHSTEIQRQLEKIIDLVFKTVRAGEAFGCLLITLTIFQMLFVPRRPDTELFSCTLKSNGKPRAHLSREENTTPLQRFLPRFFAAPAETF